MIDSFKYSLLILTLISEIRNNRKYEIIFINLINFFSEKIKI